MFVQEKEYNKPQFDFVVIESVDVIAVSYGDNDVGIEELMGLDVI